MPERDELGDICVVEKLDQLNVVRITIRRIRIRRGCAGHCDALAPCICDSWESFSHTTSVN